MACHYYFVSSPLHLLFACNVVLANDGPEHVAVLAPRVGRPFSPFADVLRRPGSLFQRVISFETGMRPRQYAERKRRLSVLRDELTRHPPGRIHTGTDRRVEFQYAMHVGRRLSPSVRGIYLDEGMATYLGHKSSRNLAHRYLDPLGKKLLYGRWWDNPLTIGSSRWIDEIHVAYPELVHESLRHKPAVALDRGRFRDPRFVRLCRELLGTADAESAPYADLDGVLVLTHESFYPDPVRHLQRLVDALRDSRPDGRFAVKVHPRSERLPEFEERFPDLEFLPRETGMELFLPLLDDACVIVGDVSSALFTTRWFSDRTRVLAVRLESDTLGHLEAPLSRLFDALSIERTDLAGLADRLDRGAGAARA